MHAPLPKFIKIPILVALAGLALSMTAAPGQSARGVEATGGVAGGVAQGELPIRRITLYRSGVGSFERRGLVDGDATIQLRFQTDQINDILKSMVVLDLSGKGQIQGVSYGSKAPLARRLSSFGVDIADSPAAGELLQRLRGTEVSLTTNEGTVSGTILNVEKRPTVFQGSGTAGSTVFDLPWINLLTEKGVKSVNLTTVTGFEILDKALAGELEKALTALAEYRADRTKTVDVQVAGQGARELVVSYVQESPVWKTSYRLILPDAAAEGQKGTDAGAKEGLTLQGWAIVENTTDDDWNNVALALVSGRPVSFQMDLYEPMYVFRPQIPVPTVPGVMPRAYEGGGVATSAEEDGDGDEPSDGMMEGGYARGASKAGGPMAPGSPAPSRMRGNLRATTSESAVGFDPALSGEQMGAYAARVQAAAMEVGEVFQYQLESPVTVARQRSAMLPIIGAGVEGRRVSIFSPADGSKHPMRGVEMVNSTKLQLIPGPISVYDGGAYAGDAQIGQVGAGEKRLLAYAVDLDVSHTRNDSSESTIQKIRVVKGLVEFVSLQRRTQAYTFANKDAKRGRRLIVEHPRDRQWELKAPAKADEQTDVTNRFELSIEPAKSAELQIVEERTDRTAYGITTIDLRTFAQYVTNGKASKAVQEAIQGAAERQNAISAAQRTIESLERERQTITADQDRLRQNMNSIDRQSDLYRRYMQKFGEQETRMEAIVSEVAAGQAARDKAQAAFDSYVAELEVE